MTNRESILRSIRYIEANLGESIPVSDVAREAGYSLYHFIRLFSAITGFTPKDYILHRKLTEAAKLIASTDRRIIDIAFEFEFQTHESFTRAFRRFFGENPAEYRRSGGDGKLFLEPLLSLAERDERGVSCERVTLGEMHFIGLSVFVQENTRLISEMWNAFGRNCGTVAGRKIPEVFAQVSFWTDDSSLSGFFCMAGVEVSDLSCIPSFMCGKTLEAGDYLRFIHKGLSKDVGRTYERIYGEIIPSTEYRLTLPYNIELYGKGFLGPNNPESESEIYIPVTLPGAG